MNEDLNPVDSAIRTELNKLRQNTMKTYDINVFDEKKRLLFSYHHTLIPQINDHLESPYGNLLEIKGRILSIESNEVVLYVTKINNYEKI